MSLSEFHFVQYTNVFPAKCDKTNYSAALSSPNFTKKIHKLPSNVSHNSTKSWQYPVRYEFRRSNLFLFLISVKLVSVGFHLLRWVEPWLLPVLVCYLHCHLQEALLW